MSYKAVSHCGLIASAAMLVVALSACGRAVTPLEDTQIAKQLEGEAQSWTGSKAVVRAVATNRQDTYLVTLGSIDSTGNFSVTLPASVEVSDSLAPLACQEFETGSLEVTPSTLKVSFVETLTVAPTAKEGEPEIGELTYADRDQASRGDVTRVIQAYAPEAGTVRGTCQIKHRDAADGSVFSTETFSFDLTVAAGWNDVVRTSTLSDKDFLWAYETRTPPLGLSWHYWEYPPPPHDGPPAPSPVAPLMV